MMRQSVLALTAAVALAWSMAAAAQTQEPPHKTPPYKTPPQTTAPQAEGSQTVIVTGCVAAGTSPGSFVLAAQQTPLSAQMSQHMSGTVPSPTYQLHGHAQELQGLVGHRVEVKGTTGKQPEKTVDVNKEQKSQPKAEGTSGKTPTVKTETQEKVELRRLDVQKIRSVEGACK